jgi:hypothetical protein
MKAKLISNYKLIFHLYQFFIFFIVFYIGSINLFTNPLIGLFILLVNFPISNFLLKATGIEELVKKEKEKQ